jgi:hypothetical protein
MTKIVKFVLPILFVSLLTACHQISGPQVMDKAEAVRLVSELAPSGERAVAVAVLENPKSQYRIDSHGYPAWTWRGQDDLGACIHIDPVTKEPYLETQYPKASRGSVPKYIDFLTDGQDWQCRIHVTVPLHEQEKNWSDPLCHQRGKALLDHLLTGLAKS